MIFSSPRNMLPSICAASVLFLFVCSAQSSSHPQSKCEVRPYTVEVDPSFIEATRMKAGSFRPSIDIKQPAWAEGPPVSTMVSLARYWAEAYDWMAVQSQINNNFSHYMATVPPAGNRYNESLDLHFIHQRSKRENAVPILMIHGWPSSSLEWQKVIPGLVDPADDSKPAFHVVAPDLPGYGFSPAPTAPDLGASGHSAAFANLMEQLGYERYAVYSTDIGFVIGRTLVQDYAPRIINHVTDFYVVSPDDADMARYATSKTTPEETAYMRSYNAYFATHSAYIALHSTLPLSVAHALNDSPVGFLAWIYQIIYTASDQTYTASELVTQALLLYINGVYGNIRSYVELPLTSDLGPENRTTVPTSVLQFGSLNAYPELSSFNYVPRKWIERTANLTYWARHKCGAHFPALSAPELVLEDMRAIFK